RVRVDACAHVRLACGTDRPRRRSLSRRVARAEWRRDCARDGPRARRPRRRLADVTPRQAVIAMAAAIIALAIAWRVMPSAAPPVYDGLCTADPYRLLGSNPAPDSASKTYAAT